jgi:hypothetical protein
MSSQLDSLVAEQQRLQELLTAKVGRESCVCGLGSACH